MEYYFLFILLSYWICQVLFYYGYNIGELPVPNEHRGMKFIQLHSKVPTAFQQFFDMIHHIVLPARSIGSIFLIHKSRQVMLITILYKLLNPKGKVVVMSDLNSQDAINSKENEFIYSHHWLKRRLIFCSVISSSKNVMCFL